MEGWTEANWQASVEVKRVCACVCVCVCVCACACVCVHARERPRERGHWSINSLLSVVLANNIVFLIISLSRDEKERPVMVKQLVII
jgi:hypothetical protein